MVNRQRFKAYALVASVFLLGALAGGGAAYAFAQKECRDLAFDRGAFERRRMRALSEELDLTDAQRDRIQDILRANRAERRRLTREAFERCGTPLRSHREKLHDEIRGVLAPEQRKRYQTLVEEHRRRGPRGDDDR